MPEFIVTFFQNRVPVKGKGRALYKLVQPLSGTMRVVEGENPEDVAKKISNSHRGAQDPIQHGLHSSDSIFPIFSYEGNSSGGWLFVLISEV